MGEPYLWVGECLRTCQNQTISDLRIIMPNLVTCEPAYGSKKYSISFRINYLNIIKDTCKFAYYMAAICWTPSSRGYKNQYPILWWKNILSIQALHISKAKKQYQIKCARQTVALLYGILEDTGDSLYKATPINKRIDNPYQTFFQISSIYDTFHIYVYI